MRELPPGSVLNLEEMKIYIINEKIEDDKKIPGDKGTMRILSQLANTINPEVQTTFEVPSDFPDKKMPYLDTKVYGI